MYLTSQTLLYQLLRMNPIPFYFENKSQIICTRNTVKFALYFYKAEPHAAVFIVVFQVYVNYFILKSNYNEFGEKPFFLSFLKLFKFQAEKFLISGYLMTNNSGCSFL